MNDEDRITKLEREIRGFNNVIAGVQGLQGGFGILEKKDTLAERVEQIKMAHENFAIQADGVNATCEGNVKTGCAVNFKCPETGGETGGIPLPPPPPPENTGACCFEDGSCDIETEAECADDGGTYQGDDVTCEEADCPQPPDDDCCPGRFTAFDGSDRTFRTLHRSVEFSTTCAPFPGDCCESPDPIISFLSAEDYSAFESSDVDCNPTTDVVTNTHTFTSCTGVEGSPSCCADWDATVPFDGWTVDSATEQHSTSAGAFETVTLRQELSDECPCTSSCGFLNPDDGMYYLSKNYSYETDSSNCHPDDECVLFDPHGAGFDIWWFNKPGPPLSELLREGYHMEGSMCVLDDPTHQDVDVQYNCFCECFEADPPCSSCDCSGCEENSPPTIFYPVCTDLIETITYSDLSPCQ